MDHIGPYLEDRSTELHPGDTRVLYTDGLTDARRDGRCCEIDGFIPCLREEGVRGARSRQVTDRLFAELSGAHSYSPPLPRQPEA